MKNRNRLIFENKSWSEDELIRKVLYDACAWEEVSQAVKHSSPRCTRHALPTSELKGISCFTDGAWNPISGHSGQGWAFVNPSGDVIRHYSSNRLHVATPIVAEALAVKAALLDAVTHDFLQLNVFSDSKSLVNLLNSSSSTVLLHSVLFDIRVLCGRFDSISFSFVSRSDNVVADSLAKNALLLSVTPPVGV